MINIHSFFHEKRKEFIIYIGEAMTILENILIGLSLSMDAFTISLAEGIIWKKYELLILSICFGLFQCIMTILGTYIGSFLIINQMNYQKIISFIILLYISIKMLNSKEEIKHNYNILTIIALSIITSLDALSLGIAISFYIHNIFIISLIIGIVTFIISLLGCILGKKIKNVKI